MDSRTSSKHPTLKVYCTGITVKWNTGMDHKGTGIWFPLPLQRQSYSIFMFLSLGDGTLQKRDSSLNGKNFALRR